MRLNKMTGRVIATMGIAAMMMTQTAGVMAAEQTENKQLKVVYYNQADYPGKKIGGSTIQAAGCGPTAVAVCYSSLTGKKADVPKMCKQAYKLSKLYGMECKGLGMDKDAVEKALRAGHPVVALMGPGDFTKNGHFVVLTRMVGKDKVKIADVGSRARTAETWSLKKVIRQGKEGANAGGPFWEISVKEEKQEEPDYKQKMLDGHKNIDAVTNAIDKIAD